MTEPQAEAAADPGPEVKPEIISDLDVPSEDVDDIIGGRCPAPNARRNAYVPGVSLLSG